MVLILDHVMSLPTASIVYLKILYRLLESNGVNKDVFLRDVGLVKSCRENASRELSDTISNIWNQAENYTGLSNLSLTAGINSHPSDYGVMSYVWMNCKNFQEILEYVCKYKELINEAFSAKINPANSDYEYILESNSNDYGHLIEFDFASILHMGYFVAGIGNKSKVKIKLIDFKHEPNSKLLDYKNCFNCQVNFSQPYNRMVLSKEVLNTAVVSPNKHIQKEMLSMIKRMMKNEIRSKTLSEKTSAYVADRIAKGQRPTQDQAAQYFCYSSSKLKRLLSSEDTSFTYILNSILKTEAFNLLKDKQLSISDISLLLGFTSNAAFYRTFRRWTDSTPNEYRNKNHD